MDSERETDDGYIDWTAGDWVQHPYGAPHRGVPWIKRKWCEWFGHEWSGDEGPIAVARTCGRCLRMDVKAGLLVDLARKGRLV